MSWDRGSIACAAASFNAACSPWRRSGSFPIAPFTLVNLVAGASKIRFADYLLGTIIGMAPGLILMSALGYQIWSIITEPTLTNILLFVLAVLAWLAASIGGQALLLRWRRRGN